MGSSVYFKEIRSKVNIPMLRKDFIIDPYQIYEVDGTPLGQPALHPVAILVTTAQASLAVEGPLSLDNEDETKRVAAQWVEKFWQEPLRTGDRRYYDNCLYLFALLALSGNYRIW